MDAIIKKLDDQRSGPEAIDDVERPSRSEAEEAVKTLILWAGDNPGREGLRETPQRVVKAYEEFFAGYAQDAREYACTTAPSSVPSSSRTSSSSVPTSKRRWYSAAANGRSSPR